MTYNEKLVERIRRVLPPDSSIDERKMFGGVAFLRSGKMFVGVANADLTAASSASGSSRMLRIAAARASALTAARTSCLPMG